jgi:hypothetical protein
LGTPACVREVHANNGLTSEPERVTECRLYNNSGERNLAIIGAKGEKRESGTQFPERASVYRFFLLICRSESMNKKIESVHCRVTPAEKLALEKFSIREGLNLSETLRLLLREGAKSKGLEAIGLLPIFGEDLILSKGEEK